MREGWIEAEWAANSQLDGKLDAERGQVELTFDPLLRELLSPCVEAGSYGHAAGRP